MKFRCGQIAIYLLVVLVAITVLALMNVGIYLSVSAKNRAMNAGDAVALAVARTQGELLNRIGELNVSHLRAVVDLSQQPGISPEESEKRYLAAAFNCDRIMREAREKCFLGPLDGIRMANEWAQKYGITERDDDAEDILRQHIDDILNGYAIDPEQYPEPWEGAWREYASALGAAIGGGLYAAPENNLFVDAAGGHLLLNPQFYSAIEGRNWCWFHFNAPGVVENWSGIRDWGPLPTADDATRRRRCSNSEIYSLNLEAKTGSAMQIFGSEQIMRIIGCSEQDLLDSAFVTNQEQVWYFYDSDLWRKWYEIDPNPNSYNGDGGFPVVGKVRREYDVRGCAAVCRVTKSYANVIFNDEECITRWVAAAKPFGLVLDDRGELLENGFVMPSFDQVRLVPLDAVGGCDEERPNLDMLPHIRNCLSEYLANGSLSPGCYYCNQLQKWADPSIHAEARDWLTSNARTCVRPVPGGSGRGGTRHGH